MINQKSRLKANMLLSALEILDNLEKLQDDTVTRNCDCQVATTTLSAVLDVSPGALGNYEYPLEPVIKEIKHLVKDSHRLQEHAKAQHQLAVKLDEIVQQIEKLQNYK